MTDREEQMEQEAEKALLDEWYRTGENPYVCP